MKKMQRSELSLTIKLKKEMNRSALDCHVNYLQNKPQKAIFVPPPPSPEKRYFKFWIVKSLCLENNKYILRAVIKIGAEKMYISSIIVYKNPDGLLCLHENSNSIFPIESNVDK